MLISKHVQKLPCEDYSNSGVPVQDLGTFTSNTKLNKSESGKTRLYRDICYLRHRTQTLKEGAVDLRTDGLSPQPPALLLVLARQGELGAVSSKMLPVAPQALCERTFWSQYVSPHPPHPPSSPQGSAVCLIDIARSKRDHLWPFQHNKQFLVGVR